MRTTLWKEGYLRSLWPICKRTRIMHFERSSSGSTKCRARIAWPISTASTSPQINCAHWSASGSPSLKPTLLSSLQMITTFAFLPLRSRRDGPTRSRKLHMLSPHKSVPFARRWSKLSNVKHPAAHFPSWQPSWFLRWLVVKSKRPRKASIHYKTFVNLGAMEISFATFFWLVTGSYS